MTDAKKKLLVIVITTIFLVSGVIVAFALGQSELITKVHVVKFSDGDSIINEVKVNDGELVSKPDDPEKEGYTFIEWDLDDELYDFNTKVTSSFTLEAKWQELGENSIVVSFNTHGGTDIPNQVIDKGEIPTRPEDPVKDKNTFLEWRLSGEKYDFDRPLDSDITLSAIYSVTVTLDTQGGNAMDALTVESGNLIEKPADPTRDGYTFAGWWSASSGGQPIDFEKAEVDEDMTIYAHWDKVGGDNPTPTPTPQPQPQPVTYNYILDGQICGTSQSNNSIPGSCQRSGFTVTISGRSGNNVNLTKTANAPTTEQKTVTFSGACSGQHTYTVPVGTNPNWNIADIGCSAPAYHTYSPTSGNGTSAVITDTKNTAQIYYSDSSVPNQCIYKGTSFGQIIQGFPVGSTHPCSFIQGWNSVQANGETFSATPVKQ
jgi:uncharacterized repeat protein (TIGR02543 family)